MNNFIRENLSEEEQLWALMKLAQLKKLGFGKAAFTVQASRFTAGDVTLTEDPVVFKKLYAGIERSKD